MKLNQVTIPVTDIQKSIKFYGDLGLNLIVHTHDRYARFECPDEGTTLSLHVVDSILSNHRTTIYFEHDSLDEYVSTLQNKGIEFESLPKDQTWLWREARLSDPDGNPIIFYFAGENRLNPPWRMNL